MKEIEETEHIHILNIGEYSFTLTGQEDYQTDNILFLEFTTDLGLEVVNMLFSNPDQLLEIKVQLDEAERIYKNFCVYKQLHYSTGEVPIYRVTLEQSSQLASALSQITELQLALMELYEGLGGE